MGAYSGKTVVIVGGGPAGLIAAETIAAAGCKVHVYDRKPSVARKFLIAGRGGLNLTHSEDFTIFMTRYGAAQTRLESMIAAFTPQQLREWCDSLGQKTFVGSSGRVFPESFKASSLLRAWLARLADYGVDFHLQQTWAGWDDQGRMVFQGTDGRTQTISADAMLLALGGASWPGLGSDGCWVDILRRKNIPVADMAPSNCGFVIDWSPVFRERFAGQPLKGIFLTHSMQKVHGEAMISQQGLEGGAVYALSSAIRRDIEARGKAEIFIDLKPAWDQVKILQKLKKRGRQSFSTYLQKGLSLPPVAIGLLREANKEVSALPPEELARIIKNMPLKLEKPFGIDKAISSAGGVRWEAVNNDLMLDALPGVFVAGEMLDWEAPTGGYLLQACFATGRRAAQGILDRLSRV